MLLRNLYCANIDCNFRNLLEPRTRNLSFWLTIKFLDWILFFCFLSSITSSDYSRGGGDKPKGVFKELFYVWQKGYKKAEANNPAEKATCGINAHSPFLLLFLPFLTHNLCLCENFFSQTCKITNLLLFAQSALFAALLFLFATLINQALYS